MNKTNFSKFLSAKKEISEFKKELDREQKRNQQYSSDLDFSKKENEKNLIKLNETIFTINQLKEQNINISQSLEK